MSNKKLSDDDIEALASSPLHYGAKPSSSSASASAYTQKAQKEAERYKESASQFQRLEQHTNKLLSDYKDFLSDIDSSASADVSNSSDEEDEEEVDIGEKGGNNNLATIHEDSSSFNSSSRSFNLHQSTGLDRPDYSGGYDYDTGQSWDYNMNKRNHNRAHQFAVIRRFKSIICRNRYGFSLKQTGWLMTIISIIVLLVVILFVGTNTKADDDVNNATLNTTQKNNNVSTHHPSEKHNHPNDGYPNDYLDRPPSIEEDDLSSFYGTNDIGEDNNSIDPVYIPVDPVWFTEVDGWTGTSYLEGVNYCASMGGRSVCTYEEYCPNGPGNAPYQGVQAPTDGKDGNDKAEWLSPVYIDQPIWIGVSKTNSCIWKGILDEGDAPKVKSILCCPENSDEVYNDQSVQNHSAQTMSPTHLPTSKPTMKQTQPPTIETPSSEEPDDNASLTLTAKELAILQYMNPQWYGRKDGYLGTTHQHAVEFCSSVQGRQLCLPEAYCPNGEGTEAGDQPLFLRMDLFPREQWAPTILNGNSWLLVGHENGNLDTCQTYESSHDGKQPLWGVDGSSPEIKEHVMCCLDTTRRL